MWGFRKASSTTPADQKASQPATPASSFQLALLNRAHQQAAVAALGQSALAGADIAILLEHAATFIAQTLSIEFAAVHQLEADGTLRLVAGCGIPSAWMQSQSSAGSGS